MAGVFSKNNPATNRTVVTRLALIENLIRQTSDRQKVKRLNWLWWKEFFKAVKQPSMRRVA